MSTVQLLHSYLPSEQYSDDLDSLLWWLHPQGHQSRPPSLRLKNCIRKISDIQSQEFSKLLNQYYIEVVRVEYLKFIDDPKHQPLKFNDITRLEKKLSFPCTFIKGSELDFWQALNSLRHYLVDNNELFRKGLVSKIRRLILNDDLDLVENYVKWIDSSNAIYLSSQEIILNIIVEKIYIMCERHIKGKWTKRYLVMETFNKFIEKYWNHFAQLLILPEDNHDLTTTVFNCFETTFIKIRIEEIYDIFINSYPESKPTILELRKTLKNSPHRSEYYRKIIYQFLNKFERNILNPSITTVDALLSYLKSIKCFLLLDPTGRHLRSVEIFIKPFFQKKHDLINILLYAILKLQEKEFKELEIDYIKDIDKLSKELSDEGDLSIDNFNCINNLHQDQNKSARKYLHNTDTDMYIGDINGENNNNNNNNALIYENVLKKFLVWVPEPSGSEFDNNNNNHSVNDVENNISTRSICAMSDVIDEFDEKLANYSSLNKPNILDILLDLLESKELLIAEFMKLLTKHLLTLKSYKLDHKWSECLQLIRDKFSRNSANMLSEEDRSLRDSDKIDGGNGGQINGNSEIEGFSSNINRLDVMLHDIRNSERVFKRIVNDSKIEHDSTIEIYPKFISPSYWEPENETSENKIDAKAVSLQYQYKTELENEILKYAYEFSEIEANKALHFCRNKGTVEIEINLNGKEPLMLTITIPQYCVIEKFEDQGVTGLSVDEICERTKMTVNEVISILKFWIEKHVLKLNLDNGKYFSNEPIEQEATRSNM